MASCIHGADALKWICLKTRGEEENRTEVLSGFCWVCSGVQEPHYVVWREKTLWKLQHLDKKHGLQHGEHGILCSVHVLEAFECSRYRMIRANFTARISLRLEMNGLDRSGGCGLGDNLDC